MIFLQLYVYFISQFPNTLQNTGVSYLNVVQYNMVFHMAQ